MNRYYKEKKPYQGISSELKGKTPQLLPTPRNDMSYQQLISTAFHDTSMRDGSQIAGRGRNRGYAPLVKHIVPGNSGRRWPQENVAFSGGSNSFNPTDENVWEDMDFDFDDPSVMAPNQSYFQTNRYDTFERKVTFQGNRGSMMAGRGGHPYQPHSSKRIPLFEAGPSQNYYGPPAGQGYNMYETNMHPPSTVGKQVDNPAYKNARRIQQQMPKVVEKVEEDPAETLTQARLDNAQSKMEEGNFPRIYTVSVTKLKSWVKHDVNGELIFEVFGILDLVKTNVPPGVKVFVLKGQQKDKITCIFYEIDRKLEIGSIGHWQRCVGLLKNNEFQCLNLRAATQAELKNFDATLSANSKALAKLLRSCNG